MSIEIKMAATLKHLNVRKEGPDDGKVTAIDLKLAGLVPSDFIDKLLCPDGALGTIPSTAFWDSDGEPRFLSLKDMGIDREILNMETTIEGIDLKGCKVSKFSFLPCSDYKALLTFGVSSSDFPSKTIAILAEQLQEILGIHVWSPQADMFEEPKAAAKPKEEQDPLPLDDGDDPLYPEAVCIVRNGNRASIAYLQRELKIGYNRSARLIERMEAEGIVSPMQPNGQREVLKQTDTVGEEA